MMKDGKMQRKKKKRITKKTVRKKTHCLVHLNIHLLKHKEKKTKSLKNGYHKQRKVTINPFY